MTGVQTCALPISNPLVRLVLIDGVGHCVRRDAPETYHGLVDPFIEEAFEPPGQTHVGDHEAR